jgi:hypothetical protein
VAKGHSVCDLSVPGWKADTTSVSQVCAKLSTVSLTDSDVVVFDPLSNSAFCGTDDEGAPKTISKDHTGKYHCEGHLSTITSQMCSIKLRLCDPIIEVIKKSHVILLSPIPRYITTRCCGDKSHLQNFESRSLPREITSGLKMICELLQGWGEDKKLNFELLDSVGVVAGDTPLKVAQVNNGPPRTQCTGSLLPMTSLAAKL